MEKIPTELLLQFFEQAVPFNRLLGLKVLQLGDGEARVLCPFQESLIGDPMRRALHGGVIATVADGTGGIALAAVLGPRDRVSTVDIRVDYLSKGEPADFVAAAKVVRVGNKVGAVRVDVFHPGPDGSDPAPFAVAMAVYNVRRG